MSSAPTDPASGERALSTRLALIVAGFAVLFAAAIVSGIVLFANSLEWRDAGDSAPVDGIVVLTGGADRISEALSLLERGKGKRLLISGVGVQSPPEALRRRWQGRDALFDCCVDLDYQARNTRGNALEARRWAEANGFRSLMLVTASYHLPRARLELIAAMPGVQLRAHPVVPEASRIRRWWQDPALVRIITLEFFKYWAACLRITLGLPAG